MVHVYHSNYPFQALFLEFQKSKKPEIIDIWKQQDS